MYPNQRAVAGGSDDMPLYVVRKDFSGGMNNRQHESLIGENQVVKAENVNLGVAGQTSRRLGSVQIANDVSNDSVLGLHNFGVQAGNDQLLMYEGTSLHSWTGTGNWTEVKGDFSASTEVGMCSVKQSGISPDDIVIIQNGIDNAYAVQANASIIDLGSTAGTGSDSPPKSTVMGWYGNRLWVLKDDLFYYSEAYPSTYSTAFDTATGWFRIPVGRERGIVPTRDIGIIVMGEEQIWGIAPSVVPDPTTDKPEPLVTEHGVVSKTAFVNAGDDVYYFAKDGFRALKRTVQDKLQAGQSFPISYGLKTEFEKINWAYISRLSMTYFDNKVFIAVPTSSTTFDTWVYYPASNSFFIVTGWSPNCWAKFKVDGQERLYYGKLGNGVAYRAWYGYTDEGTTTTDGTAISMNVEGREEDCGQPLVYKNGGELEITAESSGSGNSFKVYVAVDGGAFQELGDIDLSSDSAPTLPIELPFSLSDSYLIREKFHLDSLGAWRTLQIKITNSDVTSDPIIWYGYNIMTFQESYYNE
jgi:hypothetical protein